MFDTLLLVIFLIGGPFGLIVAGLVAAFIEQIKQAKLLKSITRKPGDWSDETD